MTGRASVLERGGSAGASRSPDSLGWPFERERGVSPSHLALGVAFALVFAIAAYRPSYPRDFWLENLLVLPFVAALVLGYRRFRFSTQGYVHIFVLLALHELGAHYTYSETPLGFWMAETLGLWRNHYDRAVHFVFGALMLLPLRELLAHRLCVSVARLTGLTILVLLGLSGLYELIESWAAQIVAPELGTAFLGTQGDEWDAQRDMTCALVGALLWTTLEYGKHSLAARAPVGEPEGPGTIDGEAC